MKLIIINGPCGIGKSTLAARLHDKMPLSFLLDVDTQARFISHYREFMEERHEMVHAVSLGIIEACLKINRSVIVDKMTFHPAVLDAYHEMGKQYKAEIHEVILWAPKDVVMARAQARGWKEGGLLTPEKCERFWGEIDQMKSQRAFAKIIDVSDLTEDEALEQLAGEVAIV